MALNTLELGLVHIFADRSTWRDDRDGSGNSNCESEAGTSVSVDELEQMLPLITHNQVALTSIGTPYRFYSKLNFHFLINSTFNLSLQGRAKY